VTGVAALYIDPRGPYPRLLGADACWDEQRDARLYEGPWPVVAHPPCRNWGSLRHLATADDSDCGPRAVAQVRRWGGVLEHPARSTLFAHCGIPKPGELPDAFGGRTIEVCQIDWGHVARKRTWLYIVGPAEIGPTPPAREPTHWCSGFRSSTHASPKRYKTNGCAVPPGIKVCSAQQRRRTPVAFAEWLIDIARRARPSASSRKVG
jgi:hypothetical protein